MLAADPRVTARVYYNVVLRLDPEAFAGNSVDVIARALSGELGISVNPVYVPLNRHALLCPQRIPAGDTPEVELARLDMSRFTLPEAQTARRTCVTLPHPVLLDDEEGIKDVARAIEKVQGRARELLDLPQEASQHAF